GIVYDTGGLSLKGKADMPGMKGDMGGAAAVLEAFRAAALLGSKARLDALLCLAENAVGPRSVRPDDVLTMYSGRRVEVNNTDAEGRLVLADGVAYAVKHLAPEVIVDLATLTGAQLIATGRKHAAIVCNDDDLEARAVAAGKASGDLVHPLPYVPEFFREEFKSRVADLKNSVKDRMNAQSSCAAQFIAEHLGDYAGKWLHVDIAGPSTAKERGTGFGVALLLDLIG
ncbi:MAG: leucyl aminopeptidase family protein, partial [Myxococcales bacterium]|nr:leucyl aminopeptidase family protein [Myxococcales bacterium]